MGHNKTPSPYPPDYTPEYKSGNPMKPLGNGANPLSPPMEFFQILEICAISVKMRIVLCYAYVVCEDYYEPI